MRVDFFYFATKRNCHPTPFPREDFLRVFLRALPQENPQRHPYSSDMPVGRFATISAFALSCTSLSRVNATFAPSVTAPRRLRTFFASPIRVTVRPAAL